MTSRSADVTLKARFPLGLKAFKTMKNHCRILFSYAFRPFFLLSGAYAVVMVSVWGLYLGGALSLPEGVPVGVRHGHEMLFGFAGGAIAGFLLTAVATWTGRAPVSGAWLAALCGVWLTARLAAFWPGDGGLLLWAATSLAFWGGLLGLMARQVIAAGNARNYKVLPLLAAFLLSEAYFFAGAAGYAAGMQTALRIGLFLVLGMIFLVGGRIIPNFTQNWLRANRPEVTATLPAFDRLDLAAVLVSALFGVGFVLAAPLLPSQAVGGEGGFPLVLSSVLGALAALLQTLRLVRWRGWLARREPLLWVLHLGYAWIPLGFALLALGLARQHAGWLDAGLHALTYGAIGTLILGVAARVALGHTGRPIEAISGMVPAFVSITLGAVLRVSAPPGSALLWVSAGLWVIAYGLFLLRYAPILSAPRR